MAPTVRRFLVFQAFLAWQGGFLFYAAVVVPAGTELLGAGTQGEVTREVTAWLNRIGFAWAAVTLWDLLADPPPASRRRKRLALGLWAVAVVAIVWLVVLRGALGELLDSDAGRSASRAAFRRSHVAYLWLSTLHWLIGLYLAYDCVARWGRPNPNDDERTER